MSSVPPIKIFLPILSFVYDFRFEGESSSTANTQEQLLELGARIDHVSEKMSGSLSCLKICDEDDKNRPGIRENINNGVMLTFFYHDACVIPFHVYYTFMIPTRYDFEANKKNNLIFYGLPSDPRETPNSLVTKVEHRSFADVLNTLVVWFGLKVKTI